MLAKLNTRWAREQLKVFAYHFFFVTSSQHIYPALTLCPGGLCTATGSVEASIHVNINIRNLSLAII
jgi:hypothetical protein